MRLSQKIIKLRNIMKKTTLSIFAATLLLSPAFGAEDLGEVIVTSSSKLPQKAKASTQNVTVVTAEDIQEKGYQSVPEVLSHTAGFMVTSNGGAGQTTSAFVRGLSSDNLLVLIDGVPLTDYTSPSAAAALEHISIDSIEKIEIVKGGQSGIWGASAAAGTVNIITKGGAKDSARIILGLGSHSTKKAGFDISKNFSAGSISLGAHISDTDGISALSPVDAEADEYKNINLYLNGEFNINANNSLSMFIRKDDGKFDYDGFMAPDDSIPHGESKQKLYGVGYSYKNGALTIDAKASQRKIDRSYVGDGYTLDTNGKSTQLSLTAGYEFSDKNSLTVGAERNIHKADNILTLSFGEMPTKAKFSNSAVFASYSHAIDSLLGADTTFNAVVRYDKFDKFDNKATYRLGIKRDCKAVDGLHSAANIYTGYKAPSLFQFSNAAAELKPESVKGYDLSIGYKKYINITYFNNKIKDKITSSYDPATYTLNYFNDGDGIKTTGLEISGEYAFGDSGFVLGANWTHMLKFKDDSGKKALRIPRNSGSLYLDYYFGEASHVGILANYVGERRDLDFSAYPAKDVTLKSYTTVDLTYNTKFNDNISLNITAKNIFDKKYETVKGYSTEGRSVYANVEYKF